MKSVRRVLIASPYGIGDLLFLTPVLRALKLLPAMEQIDLLLGSRTEEVLKSNPHVDHIYSFDRDHYRNLHGFYEKWHYLKILYQKLKKTKYDLFIDFSRRPEYGLLGAILLQIPLRIGYQYRGSRLFLHEEVDRFKVPIGVHHVDTVCSLIEKVGIQVDDRFLEFYVTDQARLECAQFLKKQCNGKNEGRFAVIAPGGGESWGKDAHFKRWPVKNFAALSKKYFPQLFDYLVILGSSQEKELGDALERELDPIPVLQLCGQCSLSTTAALLEKTVFFIGNDGGLMHLAHALKIPVIAFFGPVDPREYGPYPPSPNAVTVIKEGLECRPCYRKFRYQSDCSHRKCLQDLSLEEAEKKITFFMKALSKRDLSKIHELA